MSAPVIEFKGAVVAQRARRGVVIALFDGDSEDEPACVAILLCSREAARGLLKRLGSATQAIER